MLGLGISIPVRGTMGGAIVDPYANFLLFDDFSGTPAPLNGRQPDKGPVWETSGVAASNMIAGDNRLTQDADVLAGYAFSDLGAVALTLIADWNNTTGTVDYPPTMSICVSNNGASKFLHGEGGTTTFLIRLGDGSGNFIMPGWSLWSPNFSLSSGVNYTTELHYDGDKWAAMVLKDGAEIIGQEVSYDPDMASYVGDWIFFETFDTKMGYTRVSADLVTDYVFPTLIIMLETSFATGPDGFVTNAFGGDATWGVGGVTCTGSTYVQGGAIPIGSILTGDKIYVSFDVTAQTAGNVMSLIATGVAGGASAEIFNVNDPGTTGRVQQTFTVTTDTPDASFIIGNDGVNGPSSITLRDILVIKNPPTSF